MPGYDLSKLTEFSYALIYGFEPEATQQSQGGSTKLEDTLYGAAAQHDELLDAYLYAQNTILPAMKADIQSLQAAQLKLWINGLHQRLAKTLLASGGEKSGQYSEIPVLRWHSGGAIQTPIISFLSGLIEPKPTLDDFVLTVSDDFKADKNVFKDFMSILLKLQANNSIELSTSQRKGIPVNDPYRVGITTLSKLQAYYYGADISSKDKLCIEQIVKICMPCERYETIMDEYCTKMVAKLKTIDKTKLDDVVDFLADAYYELTEIHPYPNCNGRTATCVMNIFLRHLGWPSILFRYPTERDDPKSIYSQVFEKTDVNKVLLRQHIKQRILDTKKEAFADPVLKLTVENRVAFALLCQRMQKNHPEFDVNVTYKKELTAVDRTVISAVAEQYQKQFSTLAKPVSVAQASPIAVLQYCIGKFMEKEKELDHIKANLIAPTPAKITPKLASLSGTETSAWKFHKKENVYRFISEDKTAADKVVGLLKKAQTSWTIETGTLEAGRYHVVQVKNLQPLKAWGFHAIPKPAQSAAASDRKDIKHNDDGSVHKI